MAENPTLWQLLNDGRAITALVKDEEYSEPEDKSGDALPGTYPVESTGENVAGIIIPDSVSAFTDYRDYEPGDGSGIFRFVSGLLIVGGIFSLFAYLWGNLFDIQVGD